MRAIDHRARAEQTESVRLGGRTLTYRVVPSKAARKLRVRVGLGGIEVVKPASRSPDDVRAFLVHNTRWVLEQSDRMLKLAAIRRPQQEAVAGLLYRGSVTPISLQTTPRRPGSNLVRLEEGGLNVVLGHSSRTPPERTLENWLRKRAREEVLRHLAVVTQKLRRNPDQVYIMGQRTKWGNCSAMGNLSFNWRIVLAPDNVARYLVAHEVVHLAVPDHSPRFWLTLQSICPDVTRAREWLCVNERRLKVDLAELLRAPPRGELHVERW